LLDTLKTLEILVNVFTVTPLWPVLHHSVTQPRPLIKISKYRNVACLQSLYDVELQQIFFLIKQSGAEEFSGGVH